MTYALKASAMALATAGLVAACSVGDVGSGAGGASSATGSGGASSSSSGSSTGGATSTSTSTSTTSSGGSGGGAPTELVHAMGRFDTSDPAVLAFTWSGTSLATVVDGTGASVDLDGAADVWFETIVDGASTGRFKTSGGAASYPVATGLAKGTHDVQIVRRNEGFFGVVKFKSFTPEGGALVPTPSPYAHRLEVVGDSITCGYGDEGADPSCKFSGATENAYLAYGMLAARATNAAVHLIAYSGKGVHQNYGGDMKELMPELYERTLTDDPKQAWDSAIYDAEAVVINLGTNDFSVPIDGAAFEADYVKLLKQVRGHHASASIFAVKWKHWGASNEAHVEKAVATFGDPKASTVEFEMLAADGAGCDYHPNLVTHSKLGAQLATLLKGQLGW